MQSTIQKLDSLQCNIIDSTESMLGLQRQIRAYYTRIEELQEYIQYPEDYTAKELSDMQEELNEAIQSIKDYQGTINDFEAEIKAYRGQAELLTGHLLNQPKYHKKSIMNYTDQIQALFKTGDAVNIELALTLIEGGNVTPVEAMPNLHEQYNFLLKYGQVKRVVTDIDKLRELVDLEWLDLRSNQLTTVPNFNLPNLRELYLYNNQLTTVPNFNLPNLEWLD